MARKLPWERRSRGQLAAVRRHSSSPTRGTDATRQTRSTPTSPGQRSSRATRRYRTPSTSPPPAPPTEDFMIEGMDNDDQYRMVEDELLSIAQSFTTQLHAAEYERLKALAKRHSIDAIRSMVRPVTATPTETVLRRQAERQRTEAMEKGLQRAFDNKDNSNANTTKDNAPWTGTSLQTLMDGGKEQERLFPLLATSEKAQDNTETGDDDVDDDDDDDDDDDLDTPAMARKATKTAPKAHSTTTNPQRRTIPTPLPSAIKKPSFQTATPAQRTVTFARTTAKPEKKTEKDVALEDEDDDDDDDDDLDLDAGSLMKKIRERRQRERAQRQQKLHLEQERRRRGHGTSETHDKYYKQKQP